jgi:hypothetical protein
MTFDISNNVLQLAVIALILCFGGVALITGNPIAVVLTGVGGLAAVFLEKIGTSKNEVK